MQFCVVLFICLLVFREQVELTCDILDRLLGAIPANVLLSTFHVELTRGLKHEASTVKLLCLKQVS